MINLWVLFLIVVGVVVEGYDGPTIEIQNLHQETVSLYWDQFNKHEEKNGLVFMEEIKPGQTVNIRTTLGHSFEIYESHTRVFLALVQIRDKRQQFSIYGQVQQCGKDDEALLLTPTTPLSVATDYQTFLKNALPLYREKRVIEPTPDIVQGRAREEKRRQYLNAEQPKVTPTFTKVGYEIVDFDPKAFAQIRNFWDDNRHKVQVERLGSVNHHMNHWEVPTYIISLPSVLRNLVIETVRPVLERWIGGSYDLEYTSLYGIRMYVNNSYLLNHVDRSATHAVSAIIQIDQRVDEDWLLEVIGHDQQVRYIKLLPGQMALYESASVIHGREARLRGDYFANLFVHYRPKSNWKVPSL